MSDAVAPGHELLLGLAGWVDDDLLAIGRELVAVGEEAGALELLVASLAAARTVLPQPVRQRLVDAVERRGDGDLARLLPSGAALPEHTGHVFDADAGDPERSTRIGEVVTGLAAVVRSGARTSVTWRLTPAGAAPGPLPHPVVLLALDEACIAEVLAYQVGAALARAGIPASVEAFPDGAGLPPYQRAALAAARPFGPVHDDGRPADPSLPVDAVPTVATVTGPHDHDVRAAGPAPDPGSPLGATGPITDAPTPARSGVPIADAPRPPASTGPIGDGSHPPAAVGPVVPSPGDEPWYDESPTTSTGPHRLPGGSHGSAATGPYGSVAGRSAGDGPRDGLFDEDVDGASDDGPRAPYAGIPVGGLPGAEGDGNPAPDGDAPGRGVPDDGTASRGVPSDDLFADGAPDRAPRGGSPDGSDDPPTPRPWPAIPPHDERPAGSGRDDAPRIDDLPAGEPHEGRTADPPGDDEPTVSGDPAGPVSRPAAGIPGLDRTELDPGRFDPSRNAVDRTVHGGAGIPGRPDIGVAPAVGTSVSSEETGTEAVRARTDPPRPGPPLDTNGSTGANGHPSPRPAPRRLPRPAPDVAPDVPVNGHSTPEPDEREWSRQWSDGSWSMPAGPLSSDPDREPATSPTPATPPPGRVVPSPTRRASTDAASPDPATGSRPRHRLDAPEPLVADEPDGYGGAADVLDSRLTPNEQELLRRLQAELAARERGSAEQPRNGTPPPDAD